MRMRMLQEEMVREIMGRLGRGERVKAIARALADGLRRLRLTPGDEGEAAHVQAKGANVGSASVDASPSTALIGPLFCYFVPGLVLK
jgi:hypothetical protein